MDGLNEKVTGPDSLNYKNVSIFLLVYLCIYLYSLRSDLPFRAILTRRRVNFELLAVSNRSSEILHIVNFSCKFVSTQAVSQFQLIDNNFVISFLLQLFLLFFSFFFFRFNF